MLAQFAINVLLTTCTTALMAVGFGFAYSCGRFFNFGYGAVFAIGAYCAFFLSTIGGMSILPSMLASIGFATIVGCAVELVVYRPLRKRDVSSLVLLLASLGVYVVIQNMISALFGDDTKSLHRGVVREGIDILGGRISGVQLANVSVTVVVLAVVGLVLNGTRFGKALRAVASSADLAAVSGIQVSRVILIANAVGAALGGLAGVLFSLDVNLTPTMGMNALLMGIIVVIIGGAQSVTGMVLGACLLSVALHSGTWIIGAEWEQVVAFGILLGFLLVCPRGFADRHFKTATV